MKVFGKLADKYSARFPNIQGYAAVSTTSSKGVKELQTKIAQVATAYKYVGQKVPSPYILLGKKLDALNNTYNKTNKPPVIVTSPLSLPSLQLTPPI